MARRVGNTDRTRKRVKKVTSTKSASGTSPWLDPDLQLLTPTANDRRKWERDRVEVWSAWSAMSEDERPVGNKYAPVGAVVIDWDGLLGGEATTEYLDEYEELSGPGFKKCRAMLRELLEDDTL